MHACTDTTCSQFQEGGLGSEERLVEQGNACLLHTTELIGDNLSYLFPDFDKDFLALAGLAAQIDFLSLLVTNTRLRSALSTWRPQRLPVRH